MAELRTHREMVEQGETALVGALLPLPSGWTVLPQLSLPGHQFHHEPDDTDAVLINERGIFLLEYRHWHGRIELSPREPWHHTFVAAGRQERPNPLPQLELKRIGLSRFLEERGLNPASIHVALIFPERSKVEGLTESSPNALLAGIPVLSLHQVTTWLTHDSPERPVGVLGLNEQNRIAEQLRPHSPRRLINQYQLTSCLSRTNNKTTYMAWDTGLERPMLLQELSYDPFQQPEKLERIRNELLREAKLTMQLQHEHIVHVEHVIPRDDCYYVVTEWIDDCQTLAQVLERRENPILPVEQAVAIGLALADALAYAHSQGIVHRDIRPENILVAPKGQVKIANFGLAKKSDLSTMSTFDLRQMAQENPYVPPEFKLGQTGHHRVDQRADIFSLAALIYRMLTGRVPHHLDEKYFEAPSLRNPEVPGALDLAIEKGLRFDPAQRYSTMGALRQRLAEYEQPQPAEGSRYTQRKLCKRTRSSLVFQAYDEKLQRPVALKKVLLEPHLTDAARQAQLKQLLREAQLASGLVHPHIVSVFDHFIEDGDGYIVMEWLEGHNLREWLEEQHPLSLAQIKQIVAQVGDALQYAHSQGVIHRDVKPENIVYHQGQATVLDFGIAQPSEAAHTADPNKTAGTARYMAPEVLSGLAADVRADVFSLGVVLYELITRQYPYEGNVILARYTAALLHSPTAPSELNLESEPALDSVLIKALEVDPENRYDTIADFQRAFLALEPRTFLAPPRVDRSGWPLLISLSAVVFVLFLLVGLWSSQSYRSMFQMSPVPVVSPLAETVQPPVTSLPSAKPVPSPAATPMPWRGPAITLEGVTMGVNQVFITPSRTRVQLRIDNLSTDVVFFLTRTDRPELFALSDDQGNDLTHTLDIMSVDNTLLRIEPGQRVTGAFSLNQPLPPSVKGLFMTLMEEGGKGRKFPLRALRDGEG
ncbi:MAG: protein kinase [Candidatus Sericytochromatia bacterium]|nr:protein kinase [Candidatus Sericytochromatia bacterium]